ncbi:Isoleucine--tRNA ligase [uncultured archaeon]|nr:Isoleucine--tRNA ligase [uncultured archaeon]
MQLISMQSEPLVKEKSWDKSFEPPLYQTWKEDRLYSFDRDSDKPLFSIDTPPPYVNTPVHIGQTTTYVLMDMFARFHRMTGHNIIFPLGLDRNGLPIEMAAEKKFKVRLNNTEREKFLEMCRTVLEESSATSTDSFLRCGIAFSSWKFGPEVGDAYMTDSPEYRAVTQATFIDMWNNGLIYESERTNNYCPGCRTTLADAEVDYIDIPTKFYDLAFKVKETGEEIIIATTRPELLGSCAMVIYNPADARYKKLAGKHAIVPLFNKEVPIKEHPIADIEKGSGLVMMCSFGDLSDIRFFREMNLAPIYSIGVDGRLNENAGPGAGLPVKKGREAIVAALQEKRLIRAAKDIMHRTPICERSKDPIEFIAMKEFYAKQLDQRDRMMKMADDLNFFAPESRKILIDWINSLSIDWPISRRRYYATEVPLWYCRKCEEPYVPPKGKYYRPWKERPPVKACPKCGHTEFIGEARVFDTWFDSSITALYILGYGRDDEFFIKHQQCTVRPQGKEIVRTWLYYTLLKCYLLTRKQIFRDAWINYHIVDNTGNKMSKSVGNVIDPQKILDQFGAEPFRLWAATEGNLTQQDFRCSNDRIIAAGKSLNKLWNVAKYVSMFQRPAERPKKLSPLDQWILNEIHGIAMESRVGFENYDFHNPSIRLRHFLWDTFASHYVELSKNRAYNSAGNFTKEEQESALWTLHECLNIFLRVMAPITPFITSKLYEEIYGADVHAESFPEPSGEEKFEVPFLTSELEEMNSAIWKAKKDKGLSLKDEVTFASIHEKFKIIKHDLVHAHTIRKLEFGEFKLDLPATPAPKAEH